ncbi:hypothetical protein V9T40_009932 [Parthenolecanium corni]|uniref:Reverse transcriptase domain-containing protein n=1 Tax=Parthenolecanium corni TaxID=536013 RepID=A0AAN9TNK2_9HEMI
MTTVKCQFYLVAAGDGKTTHILVRRICFMGSESWFVFPEELQPISCHKKLSELPSIKAAVKAMKVRGAFRNVNVTLTADLVSTYVDDDSNFIFGDCLLGEVSLVPPPSQSSESSTLSRLAIKEESIKSILNHFIIEKFSSKNKNVAAWCSSFEKESDRFKLSGQKKIEVFKSCLDPTLNDWFSIVQSKIGLSAEWSLWKENMVSTFGDLSWKPIRYAYSFKYLSGSYLDYSIKKEKMLLELDRELSDIFILDLIIIGLPTHIQNSLNRNHVTSISLLHNKLKKFEADDKIFPNSSRHSLFKDTKNNTSNYKGAVYDPGSNISIMNKKIAEFLDLKIIKFANASFKMISGLGRVYGITKVKIKIFDITKEVLVFILDDINYQYEFLIGLDLIYEFRLCQNENLEVFQNNSLQKNDFNSSSGNMVVNFLEMSADLSHLDFNKKKKIEKVISNFNMAFAKHKYDTGPVLNHEATIKLTEHKYIYRKPYKCNIIDQQEIESQISKLIEAGLIEESSSPFASPVTLAKKKYADGSIKKDRLCIDYSALNKIVVPDSQPFPLIEDLIVKARDCQWFSVLDINSAFWSVPLREKDRYKTAFVTQTGHYNWKRLPFGLKTSSGIFQRILRNCLKKNGLDDFCVNYIDDILVFSKTFDEHLEHLGQLLDAVYQEGFKLSLSKCNFAKNKVKYLGHIIENNATRPIFDNVKPLRDFPTPKNQKNVRQFLGKVNFYHSYIQNSATILAPLHNLLKKNTPFNWNDSCEKSFRKIIEILCSEPCLAIFNPNRETIVQTDASLEGIGAILKQRQDDGEFKPVSYFSKKLNEPQKRKKAIFLECLAIKEALTYWSHRLRGIKFTVYSDHKPLENLKVNTKVDDELRELMLNLSQFEFTIKYIPGPSNAEADCLSRNPVFEHDEISSDLKTKRPTTSDRNADSRRETIDEARLKANLATLGKRRRTTKAAINVDAAIPTAW